MIGAQPDRSGFPGWPALTWQPVAVDEQGNPLAPAEVNETSFAAVDTLLDAAYSPDHKRELDATMGRIIDRLDGRTANGALAILARYIWCYAMLSTRGEQPTAVQLADLARLACPRFAEIVTADEALLADILALPFGEAGARVEALSFAQLMVLAAVAVVGLDSAFGLEVPDEVHASVTSLDWCKLRFGVSVVVDPAAETDWLERCREGWARQFVCGRGSSSWSLIESAVGRRSPARRGAHVGTGTNAGCSYLCS